MSRLTRDDVQAERLLRATRGIAVLGAGARPGEHGHAVVEYLKGAGYEVMPVREDRADVAGLHSWASLDDVPGTVDLVLMLRGAVADGAVIAAALRKNARGLWIVRGTDFRADGTPLPARFTVVRDRDVEVVHRQTEQVAGQPRKLGAVGVRRGRPVEDDRKRRSESGWVAAGGGGHKGGGGARAVLDEKKMTHGKPSPRSGPLR